MAFPPNPAVTPSLRLAFQAPLPATAQRAAALSGCSGMRAALAANPYGVVDDVWEALWSPVPSPPSELYLARSATSPARREFLRHRRPALLAVPPVAASHPPLPAGAGEGDTPVLQLWSAVPWLCRVGAGLSVEGWSVLFALLDDAEPSAPLGPLVAAAERLAA
jgi:hypothetical protein